MSGIGKNVEAAYNANDNLCAGEMNVPHTTNSHKAVLDKESNNPKTTYNASSKSQPNPTNDAESDAIEYIRDMFGRDSSTNLSAHDRNTYHGHNRINLASQGQP